MHPYNNFIATLDNKTYILKRALPHLAGGCTGCSFQNKGCPDDDIFHKYQVNINCINEKSERGSGDRYYHWYQVGKLNKNIIIL